MLQSHETQRLILIIVCAVVLLGSIQARNASSESFDHLPKDRTAGPAAKTAIRDGEIRTDRRVYPKPPLPQLPRAGGKFIDPVFGTEIMRVTDEADGPAPGLGTYYSHWPTFNANNTRLLIRKGHTGDAVLKTFDPVSFRMGAGREILPIQYPRGFGLTWESAIWSHSNPDVIYTFANDLKGGMRLYAYDVARKQFELLKDFSFLSRGRPDYLHQMNMSADDDVFSWSHMRTKNNGDGDPIAYLVWRRSTNKVLFDTPNTMDLNEVHVDKSGH